MEKTAFEKICDLSCYCDEPQHNTRLRGKIKQMCGNVQIFLLFFSFSWSKWPKTGGFSWGKRMKKRIARKKRETSEYGVSLRVCS